MTIDVYKRQDVLFQRDLDQLHEDGNDEDEDDGLQIAQVIGIQQEDLLSLIHI